MKMISCSQQYSTNEKLLPDLCLDFPSGVMPTFWKVDEWKNLPKHIILFIYLRQTLKSFKALLACDYLTNINPATEMQVKDRATLLYLIFLRHLT